MAEWVEKKERGSLWMMNVICFLCRKTSPRLLSPLLLLIVSYFYVSSSEVRRSSLQFFDKVTGKARSRDYFRQLYCFSRTLLDRFYILLGKTEYYSVTGHGRELLLAEKKRRRGIILLGAHLGSFEACRIFLKDKASLDVHIVAYFGASQKIRTTLDLLDPEQANRVIDPTDSDAVFKMREVIESGGVLAILADRVGLGDKTVGVRFFGEQVNFPAGPYLLAHVLGCPVYSFFGLLSKPYHYDNYLECLAERVVLPRKNRQEALSEYAQRYADKLEYYCQKNPYNWFNFYDFWKKRP
jgi:predicted LPLAT superfamily acyltransferase